VNEMRPLRRLDGYLPIEDHGLIGDGCTCALVGRDGAISWMCLPRFNSDSLFCALFDHEHGGDFLVAPEELQTSRQWYLDDTGVLVTEMQGASGSVVVTDTFTLRDDALLKEARTATHGELLRHVRVLDGQVRLQVRVRPRGGAEVSRHGQHLQLRCPRLPDVDLHLFASRPLDGLETTVPLRQGEELWLLLRWLPDADPAERIDPRRLLGDTERRWRGWATHIVYDGPQEELVRRSAITLKLLGYAETGAIVAAATSSLPEAIGGVRNWDYRYSWVRDAAFSVFALRRVGLSLEGDRFLDWVLDTLEREGEPRVLYDLDGRLPAAERVDEALKGYRCSAPVRWGNAAADQVQHDVYGEILDCAFQRAARGGAVDENRWKRLSALVERARTVYDQPDQGIWEIRSSCHYPFTYSVAMCQVALDRAARLAMHLDLPGDADLWAAEASYLSHRILTDAWDDKQEALTGLLGPDGGLDASVLALPLRRVIPANHPQMLATTRAIAERLGAGKGLLYRYLPEESPDGLPGDEGAFLICSFWLVENLLGQARVDLAGELYDSLCARAKPLGLLPEQIDPVDGSFWGNYPLALSHVGLISAGVALDRVLGGGHPELTTRSWFV
jgi:alpha,alpha-trehalase